MIISKKAISRRTVLRGLGRIPRAAPARWDGASARGDTEDTAANPVRRLGIVYVPNGIMMNHWTPTTEGAGFRLSHPSFSLSSHSAIHCRYCRGCTGWTARGRMRVRPPDF